MQISADTAAVMVTHNGERFLGQQCESIFRQTLLPAVLVVVDDASRDRTRTLLQDIARAAPIPVEIIHVDGSRISDGRSRIAANVMTALAAASRYDIAVLADHDDEWLEDRVARQRELLISTPGALLVAGDGILVDESSATIGTSLRQIYPPPDGWESMDAAGRMRSALRRPFVTGAASALTAEMARLMAPVPGGWLHDRWATLVAAARGGLLLQRDSVIRYRVHGGQTLGLGQANLGLGEHRWRQVLERGASPVEAALRAAQVVHRLRPIAFDPRVRAELSWRAVLGSALGRS